MAANAPELSVVIPAYDEATRLAPTLERVVSFLDRRGEPFELVVVDDGSRDGTAALVESAGDPRVRLIRLASNRGKGAALKAGVLASRGRRVLLSDADLSTPIEELETLLPHLGEAELVFGSRAVSGSRITRHQPWHREMMGKTFNLLVRVLGVRGLRDTQCGFKLLDGAVARELFAAVSVERFAVDVELLWLARRRGYRVTEVGVEWAHAESSRVHPVVDSLSMLRDLVKLRLRRDGPPRDDAARSGR